MVAKSDYGTKMDSVILEALKPQVEEIKNKIASGGGLSHEDIITLTIYTQGNHINHIDMRMDALCEDSAALRAEFTGLEGRFAGLESKFVGLEDKFVTLESKFEAKFEGLEAKVDSKIAGLEVKIEKFRGDFSKLTAILSGISATGIAVATVISNILK